MAYKNNIPQPTNKLSTSQNDLLDNFSAINTYLTIDHVAFNGANQGKHKTVTFPVAAAPAVAPANQIGLYAAVGPTYGDDELFINRPVFAGFTTQIPFTESILSNGGAVPNNGWTWLPSGIQIMWGRAATTGIGAGDTINFPAGGFSHACFSVVGTDSDAFGNRYFIQINTITAASFKCRISNSAGAATAGNFNWLAIGY